MQKKSIAGGKLLCYSPWLKRLLIMKMIAILLLVVGLTTSYAESDAQTAKLNLKFTNGSVKDVLDEIEHQTNLSFMYDNDVFKVNRQISIEAENETLKSVVEKLISGENLKYEIVNRYIVITSGKETPTNQQGKKVTGKVTDSSGASLPGVSIVGKGTTSGVITDISGNYSLSNIPENATLQFSFVGMKTQEVKVGNQSTINVVLVEESIGLEEVVAVGYGVTKKRDVTGSVSSVSSKDFKDQPVTTLSSALQGRMAGVSVSNNSGEPGGAVKIRIRGANSIQGGNDPLIVVDGIQLTNMGLQDINVNDVQSIEVLKDASSTAIYGSRGANGVVMITTKKGSNEKPQITFNTNIGIANRAYKYDLLDPVSYAQMVNTARGASIYSDSQIQKLRNGGGTDWQNEIFRTGYTKDYQLSVSGSTPKSSYYFSGNYIDQSGIVNYSTLKKYSVRTNIVTKVNDKLTFDANIFLTRKEGYNNGDMGYKGSPVFGSIVWGPAEPVYNSDGTYNLHDNIGAPTSYNPVALTKERFWLNNSNSAVVNSKISYAILTNLTLDVIAGLDANFSENGNLSRAIINGGTSGSSKSTNNGLNWQNSNILTFHKIFNEKHDLTVTGVYEQSKGQYQSTNSSGTGLPFENTYFYNLGLNKNQSIGSYYSMWALRSWVGRLNYVYNNRYLLTATYRADGSTKFPKNPWGYFPSVALGWRLSEEAFIKSLGVFDNLKLRSSWGMTGNQAVGSFATIPTMNVVTYSYGTSSESKGYTVGIPSNSSLKWEKTTQTDFGVDMSFFKNRLSLSADYFKKKTSDLLLPVLIPGYSGGGSYIDNVGSVENKGIEFLVSSILINNKNFSWNTSFNISSVKNKVTNLGANKYMDGGLYGQGLATLPQTRIIPGESLGTFYGPKFLGIYQASEAADAAKYGFKPGDNKYLDGNKDGKIDYDDRMVIGHALPKYTFGFDNTLKYKNFEMNIFIQSSQGNQIMNLSYAAACTQVGDAQTITSSDVKPWTQSNPNNMWPSLTSTTSKDFLESSKWLQDGSFIRIKNVSLSYLMPQNMIRGGSLRLSASVQNLLTFTKYKGFDPEASTTGNTDMDGGVDLGAYPSARTLTFRLQLTL